ncbi:helix-turn-helix transcriptional regulator [Streptomyces sp. NPDC088090]|uniref:helix-turn-helix transcriptional regulator n=1 Tax=Streptomyces sp. NPDC088090 TaxID=3365822 RepID=UPI00384D6936
MSSEIADTPLMTTKQLAKLLQKSPAAIRQLRYRGQAPKGFRRGRETLYPTSEVERWMAAQMANDRLAQRAAA